MSSISSVSSTTSSPLSHVSNSSSISAISPSINPDSSFSALKTVPQNLSECKSFFVEALVDAATFLVEAMWTYSNDSFSFTRQSISLKQFIQETLRRSRTSYSTLQLALYYLILIKPHVYKTIEETRNLGSKSTSSPPPIAKGQSPALRCGRRTFLTALMLASKYSQDRNYSVAAWSKISGLSTSELSANEVKFLDAVDWNLFVSYDVYERWSQVLFECACDSAATVSSESCSSSIIDTINNSNSKRATWIDRFAGINVLVSNCGWLKPKVSSFCISPDSVTAKSTKTHPSLPPPNVHKSLISNTKLCNNRIDKHTSYNKNSHNISHRIRINNVNDNNINTINHRISSSFNLRRHQLHSVSNTFPKPVSNRFNQKLSIYTLLNHDNDTTEQLIVNTNNINNTDTNTCLVESF